VPTSTSYRLLVYGTSGKILDLTVTNEEAGCAAGTGACRSPSLSLASGTYNWYVATRNAAGGGGTSPGKSFGIQ
jgi:hypothetical protein